MNLENLNWEKCGHVTYTFCYISSYFAIIDGIKIYKHLETKRNIHGFPGKKTKVSYSEKPDSIDLSHEKMINALK